MVAKLCLDRCRHLVDPEIVGHGLKLRVKSTLLVKSQVAAIFP